MTLCKSPFGIYFRNKSSFSFLIAIHTNIKYVWQCMSDRGVSTASNRHLVLFLMTENWPDGVLSLQTEQEGRGEVLDILHAHHVITSNIKMMSSCRYIPSQSVLLLFIWSFREAVKIENISHFFFYFDSFLYKRFSFDWDLWMYTSDFYFFWLSLWDLVIDGPMFVLLKMGLQR